MKSVAACLVALAPQAVAAEPPEGVWLTEDRSVIVATGACEEGLDTLCGIIVGLQNDSYAPWADQLCGLPLVWDLKPEGGGRWGGGQVLNPSTEQTAPITAQITARTIALRGRDGTSSTWQRTQKRPVGCEGK